MDTKARVYIVRYRNLYSGFPLYRGGPGLDVNAGVRRSSSSVTREDYAVKFRLATAKRRAYDCNPQWYGEVLDPAGQVVFTARAPKKGG